MAAHTINLRTWKAEAIRSLVYKMSSRKVRTQRNSVLKNIIKTKSKPKTVETQNQNRPYCYLPHIVRELKIYEGYLSQVMGILFV